MVIDYDPLKKFLRRSAGIDIDKSDMKRLNDLIGSKLNDLLVIGVRNAGYNDRDVVMEPDLPLTKGFVERRQEFRQWDEEIGLKPILEHLATYPSLERALSADVEADAAGSRRHVGDARRPDHENHRSRREESGRHSMGTDADLDGVVAMKQVSARRSDSSQRRRASQLTSSDDQALEGNKV
jgi:hypothetical protein